MWVVFGQTEKLSAYSSIVSLLETLKEWLIYSVTPGKFFGKFFLLRGKFIIAFAFLFFKRLKALSKQFFKYFLVELLSFGTFNIFNIFFYY